MVVQLLGKEDRNQPWTLVAKGTTILRRLLRDCQWCRWYLQRVLGSAFASEVAISSCLPSLLISSFQQYLGEGWVTFGYQILLSLSVQAFGFGYAGVLRRFVVYPAWAIFPSVLPHLALNRALLVRDTKNESIHGWKIPRYRFFWLTCGLMFVYFWLPNKFFQALHAFNWMTWIAPKNAPLATITGFYGGIGFNPWATFDWNVAGTGARTFPLLHLLLVRHPNLLSFYSYHAILRISAAIHRTSPLSPCHSRHLL